ncbi:STAS domain-containing protein [Krasilnikovia sp. MM14-A1004]|uniref:STAS domain-containing protein n=1 Tax=Krasilnikovia sp. MM14-A1004 TaxID=3373541 RepID=UPI00399C814F
MPVLTVSTHADSDATTRLSATGEIDMVTAVQVTEAVEKTLADREPAHLVIDLSEVTFLDSTGMRALLTAQRVAAEHHSRLRIAGARGVVEQVLTITGLLDVLDGRHPYASPPEHGGTST